MGIYISFDTEKLTEGDVAVIKSIAASLTPGPTVAAVPAETLAFVASVKKDEDPVKEPESEEVEEPVRRKRRTKAEMEAARAAEQRAKAPEPEPEEEEDDVLGEDEDDDVTAGPTLEDAQSKAKELVGAGKTALVRKALQAVGVNRVSELKPAQIAAFFKALP